MDTFIGDIHMFGFTFAPRNWAFCNGQALAIAQYSALFALLGTTYGGDGRSTFNLPSLNGRSPVGIGQARNTAINWHAGMAYGQDLHTLTITELPSHSHSATLSGEGGATLKASTDDATTETPEEGALLAKTVPGPSPADKPEKIYSTNTDNTVNMGGLNVPTDIEIGVTGGNNAFNIIQPSLAVNFSIALEGIFPSRS